MINPLKTIKDYKKINLTKDEIELSGQFIQWAMKNGYDLFTLAFNKYKMQECVEKYKESVNNEN